MVDYNENIYFRNIYQRVYTPYIAFNEGQIEPIDAASHLKKY